jgi:hypothetical protein
MRRVRRVIAVVVVAPARTTTTMMMMMMMTDPASRAALRHRPRRLAPRVIGTLCRQIRCSARRKCRQKRAAVARTATVWS